jgi:arabinofuranan 3-O-arabinosyltransferase
VIGVPATRTQQAGRPDEPQEPQSAPRGWNVTLLGCYLVLAALPFVTAPGQIIADSKYELALDPSRFLSSALTLWNPQQFGQLQDQVVGYLFPMGPFFELGKLAFSDGWVVQRLWISAVLIVAFTGTVRLAGRLGAGSPWTRIVAGFAYALSPAALAMLGELSTEFLPAAMLPWILIPLVDASHGRQGRRDRLRAAAGSALAVALCGGVNGAATAAVLIPAGLFIVTVRGWRLLAWWVPAVAVATMWWSVPLVLQSKYGVSIVPYTESADVTTSVTGLSNVLRGTDNWVSYLVTNGQIWWPLGYKIATQALPTLLTGLVAGLGLAGLIRREMPARSFLLASVLSGAVIISAGYTSSLGNPTAGLVGEIINGPASAFRNLWKFDPLIRLPVALGLAHLLATTRVRQMRIGLVVAAIGALAVPGYVSGLAASGSFGQIPSYWVSAAQWVTAHAGRQAVLVAPGASFGQYVWGSPMDDVLASLTNADFAERDLSVIGSPGNERLLDAIDQQLAAGDGSAGLTQVIARMGIRYVVVRNDLSRSDADAAWPSRISQALANSPGITPVAQFGPEVGNASPDDAATNFDPPFPAVQIYQVAGAQPVATVLPAAGTLRVYGGPESLLTLADAGLLADRPVLVDNDGPGLPAAASVLTDSLRRRVRNFGELRSSYSPTLTAGQPASTFEAAADYTEPGWSPYTSVAQYHGIANVTASSSASDIQANPAQWGSGLLPYAAVDADPRTMWESGSWAGPVGQWIQATFDAPVNPGTIRVAFADNPAIGPPVSRVTIRTAAGQVSDAVLVTGNPQPLRVPAGPSGWLRITVTGLASPPVPLVGSQVGISGISVPGVRASRTIVAPPVAADPSVVVLAKAQPPSSGCMLTSQRWVCSPALVTPTEEQYGFDHTFAEHSPERTVVHGSATLINSSVADRYARLGLREAKVTASSTYTPDPQDQPRSVFDGNPATSWVSDPDDPHPTLTIRWDAVRLVSQVTIQRPPGVAASMQILITGSDGSTVQARGASVSGATAVIRFRPMETTSLTFAFTPVQSPVQISGIVVPGVPFLTEPALPFRLPCGLGPRLEVNGTVVPTKVTGTFNDLLTGQPLQFSGCGAVTLAAGTDRVVEPATDAFDVSDVVLNADASAVPSTAPAAATVSSWTPTERTVRVSAPTASYLVVNENFNAGWRAVVHGKVLQAVRLDGWKQAWLLPVGTSGEATLTYRPEKLYRYAVVGGLAALLLVLLIAAWPLPRRRKQKAPPNTPPAPPAPPSPPSPSLRRLGQRLLPALVACVLAAVGFWLGGYPGAGILPIATLIFLAATGYRGAQRPSTLARCWLELLQPRALAVLLVVAAVCSAAGEHLVLGADSGLAVTALANTIPQVICLVIVGRLAAALIIP